MTRIKTVKERTRAETGFAIIGPYGTIWTDRLFADADEAARYVAGFWRGIPDAGKGYFIVQSTASITLVDGAEQQAVSLDDRIAPVRT